MSSVRSTAKAAGTLIMAGFDGESPPEEIVQALRQERIGGVILFRRNLSSLDQVSELNQLLRAAVPTPRLPPLIAVDEEGGRVSRLGGLITGLPAMGDLGGLNDVDLTWRAGRMLGQEIRSLGFNTDFAPVCDVHTQPNNPVIGDRAFSSHTLIARRQASAFARGLAAGGILACAKHFPGHGDTLVDSHLDLPIVLHGRARFQQVEWVPFQGAIEADVPMIMTAHLQVPSLDPHWPATLSRDILTEILRQELGFTGVIISDDLEMGAMSRRYAVEDLIGLGLKAGLDLFLFCHSPDHPGRALETLVKLAKDDPEALRSIRRSAGRVRALRRRVVDVRPDHPYPSVVRCPEHLALREEIDRRLAALRP
ncbi:MAG: beta-N-acetylhexosaminidase [Bradymonadales bacterium]|nr:beta-N-acetylhexosaminidase [Bradymonadales bacterium]